MIFSLGSAGWRSKYGAVPTKTLSLEEIALLTKRASELGFKWIDTAPGYGDSEACLGAIAAPQLVATKLIVDGNNLTSISKSVENSLINLDLESLELVFVHNWDKLAYESREYVAKYLEELIKIGKIKLWGFSTYDVSEIIKFSELEFRNVQIQINTNVLDQRLLESRFSRTATRMKSQNHKLWARSIFLQGVLIDRSDRNPFANNKSVLNFNTYCLESGYSSMDICISYALSLPILDYLILGVNSLKQLEEISNSVKSAPTGIDFGVLKSDDSNLIDPRNWLN